MESQTGTQYNLHRARENLQEIKGAFAPCKKISWVIENNSPNT